MATTTTFKRITVPCGSTITVQRRDGSELRVTFTGTDGTGMILEGSDEHRVHLADIGEYIKVKIDHGPWIDPD